MSCFGAKDTNANRRAVSSVGAVDSRRNSRQYCALCCHLAKNKQTKAAAF